MSIYSMRQEKKKQATKRYILYAIMALAFFIPLNDFLASVALILGILLTGWRFFLHRRLKFVKLPLDTPILIFACISLLSCCTSPDKFFSFYNCTHTLGVYILAYILIAQSVEDSEDVKRVLYAILAGFLVCVLYGLYQAVFGIKTSDITWVDPAAFPELKRRIFSTMENPNIFAGYVSMILALLLGLYSKSKVYREKALYALFAVLGVIALALTYSRGSMLSVFAIFLIFGIFKDKRIIIAAVFAVLALAAFNPMILDRLASVFTTVDTSTEMRFAFFEATAAMIEDHPLLGIGWGAYFMVYPEYDFYMQGAQIKIVHAHNIYLNYPAEVGIIGALAFFWFFFGTMKLAFLAKLSDENQSEDENSVISDKLEILKSVGTSILAKREPIEQSEEKLAEIAKFIGVLKLIGETKPEPEPKEEVEIATEDEPENYPSEEETESFSEKWKKPMFKDEESLRSGLSLGIGLTFAVVALNGFFDDLLFNIPTSMFLWLLASLAVKNIKSKEE